MYVQDSFAEMDRNKLLALIAQYPFATVITPTAAELCVSHVPLLVQQREGRTVLAGHLARANKHWRALEVGAPTTAIFHGPHAYVSPRWYATSPAVPTWNYAVVHATGPTRLCNEGEDVAALLRDLTERFEGAGSGAWRPETLPVDFRASLLGAIVGFEIALERLEGKFKLSQNRSAADRAGVIAELGTDRSDASRELAALVRSAG